MRTEKIEDTLPPGFVLRHPTLDDLDGVTRLIVATDIAISGASDFTRGDLLQDWQRPSFSLKENAWIVLSPEQKVAGYEELFWREEQSRMIGDGYVHPRYCGLGIGTILLRVLEARAREVTAGSPGDQQVVLQNGVSGADRLAQLLHEGEGYRPKRYFWRMEIDLMSQPTRPVWPAGIRVRHPYPGEDVCPVFEAVEDAFRDHWGYEPWSYPDWESRMLTNSVYDPEFWFLAMDGERIAGAALCRLKQDAGWVTQLGVRKPWRRMGLGLALLQAAFVNFYQRGVVKVGLSVDAENPSGATRLYKKAGMRVAHEYIVYEKEIKPRPGVDITSGA